ncbi:hypothetical protein CR513_17395, partial [Mucuna pruriens]
MRIEASQPSKADSCRANFVALTLVQMPTLDRMLTPKHIPTPIPKDVITATSRSRLCKFSIGNRRMLGGHLKIWVECMTRSRSSDSLHSFDLEIDKTLNRIKKTKNINIGHSSDSFNSISEFDTFENKLDIADNPLYELEPMENNNRTLKELVKPDSYELKSRLIHLLPKFYSLAELEGVPRGLFHDETVGDPKRLHKDEGVFILSRWSSKGLVVSAIGHVQHVGRHEANVP